MKPLTYKVPDDYGLGVAVDQSDAARPTISSSGVREGSVPPASDHTPALATSEAQSDLVGEIDALLREPTKGGWVTMIKRARDEIARLEKDLRVARDFDHGE